MKSVDDIIGAVRNGAYKSKLPFPSTPPWDVDHVFDEEQSVRWNREQAKRLNDARKRQRDDWYADQALCDARFRNDLIAAIAYEYDLNAAQSSVVFDKAYDEGHSAGYEEVCLEAHSFAGFARKILEKSEKE